MDALGHAVECYTNNACQPISGALALAAIELIGGHLASAALNGRNRQSRYAVMLASTMAGMAMNPTRLGLAHALAMPLGSWDLRIPHGIVIAVTLPLVMEYNCHAAPERFARVAEALGHPVDHLSIRDAASWAATAVGDLGRTIGIPSGLSEYGLREEHIGDVVKEAMRSGNVVVNPRRTGEEDLVDILRRAV
jgi:alcohol dehydrogenase class IV